MDSEQNSPRGTKRKADGTSARESEPARIVPLAQDVINKIAAGEIIVAPVHALKELIENAVDAGATSLEIVVKEGGLKLLQITDNGSGINKDDLPILCERFTTSKLKAFEDLTSIGTYGFRGEALASISHIAHLTITTRTQESSCAWKAAYSDGKLSPAKPGQNADPKPCAGRQGTQITVEDLFYNIPSRRRSFRSASEEYAKILDLVGRYAVHCSEVAFSCKKHGESSMSISVQASASTVDRVRLIHGGSLANELVEFKASDDDLGFKSNGWISNANYHVKRLQLLLFINHRSVESSAIKKAIEHTYSLFLPKGSHPFVYLSLEIEPHRVDVNVHPTKREVNFLNEDEIIAMITEEIRVHLGRVDTSRTFATQSILPGIQVPTISSLENDLPAGSTSSRKSNDASASRNLNSRSGAAKPYENNLVRTDSTMRKITTMFTTQNRASSPTHDNDGITASALTKNIDDLDDMDYEYNDREPVICRLTTIKELRAAVREAMHHDLTDVFATHTFVGVVDEIRRIAAIQGGVKLFLVDYGMVANEFFYQVGLTDFGNFGIIKLDLPLLVRDVLQIAVQQERSKMSAGAIDADEDFDWDEVVTTVEAQLLQRKEMLLEYFSLEISEDGELLSLPLLMKGYLPSMAKLPQFLLRLGPYVDWKDEKRCFDTFLRELARFYVPEALPPGRNEAAEEQNEGEQELAGRRSHLLRAVEHVLFPAFKARLVATQDLLKGVIEVANLKGLYRVFERC